MKLREKARWDVVTAWPRGHSQNIPITHSTTFPWVTHTTNKKEDVF